MRYSVHDALREAQERRQWERTQEREEKQRLLRIAWTCGRWDDDDDDDDDGKRRNLSSRSHNDA